MYLLGFFIVVLTNLKRKEKKDNNSAAQWESVCGVYAYMCVCVCHYVSAVCVLSLVNVYVCVCFRWEGSYVFASTAVSIRLHLQWLLVQLCLSGYTYSDYLTGYSDYLTGFHEPLSPPDKCHTSLKNVFRSNL